MANKVPFSRLVLAKSGAFSSEEYPRQPMSSEETLWRAVIDRALHDLGSDNKRIRQEAIEWFDILNEDFVEICRLADIHPNEIFNLIRRHHAILLYDEEADIVIDITIYLKIRKRKKQLA